MPKTSKGKKRKSVVKNVPRKRLKFDRSSAAVPNSTREDGSDEEDPPKQIDEILEENASKNNLTAINVKSIIHHVVSDKRVLALLQNAVEEGEGTSEATGHASKDASAAVELDFEPKMTRSKMKQTLHADPIAALISNSPLKEPRRSPFKRFNFTDLEFPDSSSDEEYNPTLEERGSDDDTESFLSQESDLASPRVLDTPDHKRHRKQVEVSVGADLHSQPVTRSLQKKATHESKLKVPQPVADEKVTKESSQVDEAEEIARRTRSRLPLKDTTLESLEASFQPPDLTPDLYDVLPVEEMDCDDIEWQRWLQGLVLGNTDGQAEEDNDDTEYNFMAEDHKEEMEEYRNDRAVRIPQREVTELIEELLRDYEAEDDDPAGDGGIDSTSASGVKPHAVPVFMSWQREQLTEQLQQHTQLLTQLYLMCREEPTLQGEAAQCRKYVNELDGFSDRASNANLIRALGDGKVESSAFCFPGLSEALRIVNGEFTGVNKPSVSPRKPIKEDKGAGKKRQNKKAPETFLPPLSQTNQELMATTAVFKFIELLPHHTLLSKAATQAAQPRGPRTMFTDAEDNLLALGMAQFDRDFKLIHEHLLPAKSPKQLQIRCKNKSASRAPENVIRHFRYTKELWRMPREISNKLAPEIAGGHLSRMRGVAVTAPDWLVEFRAQRKPRPPPRVQPHVVIVPSSKQRNPRGVKPILPATEKPRGLIVIRSNHDNAVRKELSKARRISAKTEGAARKREAATPPTRQNAHTPRPEPGTAQNSVIRTQEETTVTTSRINELPEEEAESTDGRAESPLDIEVQADVRVDPPPEPEAVNQDTEKETTADIAESDPVDAEESAQQTKEKSTLKPTGDVSAPCDQAPANNKSNPVTAVKGKSRERNTDKSSGRVASRAQGTSGDMSSSGVVRKSAVASHQAAPVNYVLEPDPKGKERAVAFAENYMAKVKKQLKSNPDLLEDFLQTLVLSSSQGWSQVELYKEISAVLVDYPDLVEDFVAFLDPDQAIEAGVFMTNLEFSRAKTFLRKLEVHFQRNPAHFRRIVRVFNSHNKGEKSPSELHQNILPMLRGQQHLIDEFNSFFDDLRPPPCSDEDFEEVELGSGSEPESDGFEEVVIPDLCEPKKVKGRPTKPTVQAPVVKATSTKAKQPRKAVLPSKPSAAKNPRNQGTGEKGASEGKTKRARSGQNYEKKETSGTKEVGISDAKGRMQAVGQACQKELQADKSPLRQQDAFEEDIPSDNEALFPGQQMLEDPPFSQHTETSNDSCRTDDGSARAVNPTTEPPELGAAPQSEPSDSPSGRVEKVHDGWPEDDEPDVDDVDSVSTNDFAGDAESDTDTSAGQRNVILANNVQLGQDGKPVVVWTREQDRVILRTSQESGASADVFQRIASELGDKTAVQVQQRFEELVKLFTANTNDKEVKDSAHEESSSEEDTQGSESESEPVSDQ